LKFGCIGNLIQVYSRISILFFKKKKMVLIPSQ